MTAFTRANFIALIESAEGTTYLYGGIDPFHGGADCSGLVYWAGLQCGVTLPRTTQGEWAQLPSVAGTLSGSQPGDLVEFAVPGDGGNPPQHVGVIVSAGMMIDDPRTGQFVSLQQIPSTSWIWPIGYCRLPFVVSPPPPPPPEVFNMSVTAAIDWKPGQRDFFQGADNRILHHWLQGTTWRTEDIGYLSGQGNISFPNQVPGVSALGNQIVITAEDVNGQAWYFAQDQNGSAWGANLTPGVPSGT